MSRDFASLLDELLKAPPGEQATERPSVTVAVPPLDAVDAFWSSVSGDVVAALYKEAVDAPHAPSRTPELPPIHPDGIAAELGLDRAAPPKNLDRLRRAFAFENHPDRVPAEFRERAIIRMQVANRLIDEAKRASAARR